MLLLVKSRGRSEEEETKGKKEGGGTRRRRGSFGLDCVNLLS